MLKTNWFLVKLWAAYYFNERKVLSIFLEKAINIQ